MPGPDVESVFLSHNAADKEDVRKLAAALSLTGGARLVRRVDYSSRRFHPRLNRAGTYALHYIRVGLVRGGIKLAVG
jgi:hypothetical protein